MMAALTECREHFTKFGGHKAAAGMSLSSLIVVTNSMRLNR